MKTFTLILLTTIILFSCKKDEPLNTTCSTTPNIDYVSFLIGNYTTIDSVYRPSDNTFHYRDNNASVFHNLEITKDSLIFTQGTTNSNSDLITSVNETEISAETLYLGNIQKYKITYYTSSDYDTLFFQDLGVNSDKYFIHLRK